MLKNVIKKSVWVAWEAFSVPKNQNMVMVT